MFDDIPDNYKPQTASDAEEGWRYTQGDKSARRPPELLTRDHVARCINREVKAGRGSPHGGVFLDIAWIKEKLTDSEEHIKRKLPSMYHQFKELADLDITKEPMEVGPTTHYIMGGDPRGRRHADVDDSRPVRRGRVRVGHQRREPAGRQLAVRPDRVRQARRRVRARSGRGRTAPARIDDGAVERATTGRRWRRSTSATRARTRTRCRPICRTRCRPWSASSGRKREMQEARRRASSSSTSARRASASSGHREYHAGWHTAIDLRNLLAVSEAIARSAIERKESRGGHFREDYPEKAAEFGTINIMVKQGSGGAMQVSRVADPADAGLPEGSHRGAEVCDDMRRRRPSRSGGPTRRATGRTRRSTPRCRTGMVVLDAVHRIQAEQAPDLAVRWNCKAGKCGSCSAEINGKPRLMCMTRLSQLNLHEPVTVEPMRAFPPIKDLVTDVSWNFRVKKQITKFKPRQPDARRRHLADAAARHRPRPGIPEVHRVLPVPGRLPRAARSQQARGVHRPAVLRLRGQPGDEPARHRGPRAGAEGASTASATATSPSAARRSVRSTSTSPTTRSSRSRSASSIASTIRSRGC